MNQGALILVNNHLRLSGSATALSTILGFTGGQTTVFDNIKWNVGAR